MNKCFAPFALCIVLAVSACANQQEVPPTVADAQLSSREISPGETFEVSFNLEVAEPAVVERIYVRGLPKNSVLAGTQTDLRLPVAPSTPYSSQIVLRKPAADGHYNLELVIETSGKTFVAPLGPLAVRDIPSRILHAQFTRGSHAAGDCLAETRLLKLEYTVEDDNGASDFTAPVVAAANEDALALVFFPHWVPITWLDDEQGIVLNRPGKDTAMEELVSSDIRIFCPLPANTLYEFAVQGQSVSSLTGKSTKIGSDPIRYYVE